MSFENRLDIALSLAAIAVLMQRFLAVRLAVFWIQKSLKGLIVRVHFILFLQLLFLADSEGYWVLIGVGGELIREDIRSGRGGKVEPGIVLYLDINVLDVSNCQPVPDAFVELWGCNSTVRTAATKSETFSSCTKYITLLYRILGRLHRCRGSWKWWRQSLRDL